MSIVTKARKFNKPPIVPRKSRYLICDCVHPNALTCLAEQHGMSRFNAMITFGTPGLPGQCNCACHQKARTA